MQNRLAVAISVSLLMPWPASLAQEFESGIRIVEVHPRPIDGEREFIELWNPTDESIDLQDWSLTDNVNTFTFPTWWLGPGHRVVVWGGGNDSSLGPVWKANVWNNGGDSVILRDASGAEVDSMNYGNTEVPAPNEGISLHWQDAWVEGTPTPGQDVEGNDGAASATVQDLPPSVEILQTPNVVRPGESVQVSMRIDEPNDDKVQWQFFANGTEIENGTTAGAHTISASAPLGEGDWPLTVSATSTTHELTTSWSIRVAANPLQVSLPDDGIHFDGLAPGAVLVAASHPFTITNHADSTLTPHLDIGPFLGPAGTIPVDGNLELRIESEGSVEDVVPYLAPLQTLPAIAAGQTLQVRMVLLQIPEPLPAGDYRSSFTVVP